jgi:hypothetical protein
MFTSPRCWISRGLAAVALLALVAIRRLHAAPQLLPGVYGYGLDRAANSAGFGPDSKIIHVSTLAVRRRRRGRRRDDLRCHPEFDDVVVTAP